MAEPNKAQSLKSLYQQYHQRYCSTSHQVPSFPEGKFCIWVRGALALCGPDLISFSGHFPRIGSLWLCLQLTVGTRTWLVAMQPPCRQLGVAVGYYRASSLPLFSMGYIDHASEGMYVAPEHQEGAQMMRGRGNPAAAAKTQTFPAFKPTRL